MKRFQRIVHSLKPSSIAKNLNRTTFYRQAASRYDMVYFGNVDTKEDEHTLVRGLTVSPRHEDHHYCVGSVQGYDVILLERVDSLYFPYKKPAHFRWTILQVDLDRVQLPHLFLDAHAHPSVFYDAFFAKFQHMRKIDPTYFALHDKAFTNTFTLYSDMTQLQPALTLLNQEITATIGHHFSHFDIEFYEDKLLIYSSNRMPTREVIDHMFRLGIWLAREIEKADHAETATSDPAAPQII